MASQVDRNDSELIVGINVTPLVDVVLVLLVVLMITAGYIASQAIPVDLPEAATGERAPARIVAVSIDAEGRLTLDGAPVDERALREKLRTARAESPDVRALIAADGASRHRSVVSVIDVLREEGLSRFAFEVDEKRPEAR